MVGRARSPRLAGFIVLTLGVALLWLAAGTWAYHATLARRGKGALAVVVAYTPDRITLKTTSTRHLHLVEYDGFRATMNLHRQLAPGTKVPVIYLPRNPSFVARGREEMSTAELLGPYRLTLVLVQLACGALGVVAGIRGIPRPRAPPPPPPPPPRPGGAT
jgi:hypothetical protein